MDTSTFGKDDYVKVENHKSFINQLNTAISNATMVKTTLNTEETTDAGRRYANIIIKFYNLEIRLISRLLKFHPPLRDPSNVNKLDGVGTATVHV